MRRCLVSLRLPSSISAHFLLLSRVALSFSWPALLPYPFCFTYSLPTCLSASFFACLTISLSLSLCPSFILVTIHLLLKPRSPTWQHFDSTPCCQAYKSHRHTHRKEAASRPDYLYNNPSVYPEPCMSQPSIWGSTATLLTSLTLKFQWVFLSTLCIYTLIIGIYCIAVCTVHKEAHNITGCAWTLPICEYFQSVKFGLWLDFSNNNTTAWWFVFIFYEMKKISSVSMHRCMFGFFSVNFESDI